MQVLSFCFIFKRDEKHDYIELVDTISNRQLFFKLFPARERQIFFKSAKLELSIYPCMKLNLLQYRKLLSYKKVNCLR